MNWPRIREPGLADTKLDRDNFKLMVQAVNMLLGLEFSNEFSVVQSSGSILVSGGGGGGIDITPLVEHDAIVAVNIADEGDPEKLEWQSGSIRAQD